MRSNAHVCLQYAIELNEIEFSPVGISHWFLPSNNNLKESSVLHRVNLIEFDEMEGQTERKIARNRIDRLDFYSQYL